MTLLIETAPPRLLRPLARLRRGRRGLSRLLLDGLWRLLAWQERWRQRQTLLALDDRMLRDIGISRYDAIQEGRKPFWRD